MLSGDSTVREFSFDGEYVRFSFEDYASGQDFEFAINTDRVFSDTPSGIGCAHIDIVDSNTLLPIDPKSSIFYLPSSFQQQMSAYSKGHHILAGLKSIEYTKLFRLVGYGSIVICPIKNNDCITITHA